MKICGMIKTSTVDYPGKLVTIIFLGGCNFDCEYCQNYDLIKPSENIETISEDSVVEFLKKRKNVIDGLCISGGEPTIHGNKLIQFIKRVKAELGEDFLIKIDTNGSNPDFIEQIKDCVDYVALDLKALDYSKFSKIKLETVIQTLKEIRALITDYEVRITMYPAYIQEKNFYEIAEILKEVPRVSIQQYEPNYRGTNLIYPDEVLKKFSEILSNENVKVIIR